MINAYLKLLLVKTEYQKTFILKAYELNKSFTPEEKLKIEPFGNALITYKARTGYPLEISEDCLPTLQTLVDDKEYDLIKEVWEYSGDLRPIEQSAIIILEDYQSSASLSSLIDLQKKINTATDEQEKAKLRAERSKIESKFIWKTVKNRQDFEVESPGLEGIEKEASVKKKLYSVGPRFPHLNQIISGSYKNGWIYLGQLFTIMGRSGFGKSTLMFSFFASMIEGGYRCAFVATEQSRLEVVRSIYCALLDITETEWISNIETPKWLEKKFRAKAGYKTNLVGEETQSTNIHMPMIISIGQSSTVSEMEDALQNIEQDRGKFDFVFVDYPAKIRIREINQYTKFEDYGEQAQVWDELGSMAKRNQWGVVAAVQANRSGLNPKITLEPDMLGGSIRALEISAYFMTFDRNAEEGYTVLTIKKDRNTGRAVDQSAHVIYVPEYGRIEELPANMQP